MALQNTRRRKNQGWVPNYHGAWAMILVPPLLGLVIGGASWRHLPLLALWWTGYFFFFAASLWLRSRRKPRYLKATLTYGAITAVFGILTLIVAPYLLRWLPAFLPLVLIAAWAADHRKEREMASNISTIAAAGLMLPVVYHVSAANYAGQAEKFRCAVGAEGSGADSLLLWQGYARGWVCAHGFSTWVWVWIAAALVTAYFIGTALYVKTNIRKRGKPAWEWASRIYHALCLVAVCILAGLGAVRVLHALVWVMIIGRAIAVPRLRAHGKKITIRMIGLGELALSLLIAFTLL